MLCFIYSNKFERYTRKLLMQKKLGRAIPGEKSLLLDFISTINWELCVEIKGTTLHSISTNGQIFSNRTNSVAI